MTPTSEDQWEERIQSVLAAAETKSGRSGEPLDHAALIAKLRKVSPNRISLDMADMRFLGCECDIDPRYRHSIDFKRTHAMCDHDERDRAITWAIEHLAQGFNFYVVYIQSGGTLDKRMRFAFEDQNDAFWFKTMWY